MDIRILKPTLVIVTLIGMGVGLLGFGSNRIRTDRLLDESSAEIQGRVLNGGVHTGTRGGEWPSLSVEYSPPAHERVTRNFDVDHSTYYEAMASRTVIVHYLPANPKISRLVKFETLPYQLLGALGGLILLAGIYTLLRFLRERRQIASDLPRN